MWTSASGPSYTPGSAPGGGSSSEIVNDIEYDAVVSPP
jgi:hypothetical protein